jgi:hypothetical protein
LLFERLKELKAIPKISIFISIHEGNFCYLFFKNDDFVRLVYNNNVGRKDPVHTTNPPSVKETIQQGKK